jgi:hypothetical protein
VPLDFIIALEAKEDAATKIVDKITSHLVGRVWT